MRIAVFVEQRSSREIHAGAPRRQDEVDLVLRGKPLDRLDHLFGVGAVIIFDDLDLHLLAADVETAGIVHGLHPHLVVRQRGDGGAGTERTGLRDRPADLDRVLRGSRRREQRGRERGDRQSFGEFHGFRPPARGLRPAVSSRSATLIHTAGGVPQCQSRSHIVAAAG